MWFTIPVFTKSNSTKAIELCATGKLFLIIYKTIRKSQDRIGNVQNISYFSGCHDSSLQLLQAIATLGPSNTTYDITAVIVIHTQRDEVVVRCWLPAADDCAQVISCRHP